MNIINWSLIQRRLVRLEKQDRFFPVVARYNLRGAIKEVSSRRDAEYTSDPSTSGEIISPEFTAIWPLREPFD